MATVRELMGSLTAALEKEVVAVEERSQQVEKRREELEEEKRMMSSLPQGTDPANDIVEVNVGGQVFSTKRATLMSAEGSLLAAMFSGRWEDALDRDKDGRVFFDFDPAHFHILLNHLRLRRISQPEKIRPLAEQPEHRELFDAMVEFFGIRELLYGESCSNAALDCKAMGTQDGSVRVDGQRISGGPGHGVYCPVVGKAPLVGNAQAQAARATSATWKVSFTRLSPQGWVFVGVIGNPTPAHNSHMDSTSYGWNSSLVACTAGRWPPRHDLFTPVLAGLQQGDCAVIQLDVAGNRLRMCLERTGQIYNIPLEDGAAAEARLHFNLCAPGTEVVVSAATADEISRAGL